MLRFVHTSDLHLDDRDDASRLALLRGILQVVQATEAQLLILAGDTFDHNRVRPVLTEAVAALLREVEVPVVVLPGNHDCLHPDSVYFRPEFAALDGVHVLGRDGTEITFRELDVTVYGEPHRDYHDMCPVGVAPEKQSGTLIAVVHGQWIEGDEQGLRSYRMDAEMLGRIPAHYYALGHWHQYAEVGPEHLAAYYSGSPRHMRTVNVIEIDEQRQVSVRRAEIED